MSVDVGMSYITYEGVVKSVDKSLIPHIYIITIENPDIKTVFDIHKMLKIFDLNDKVKITISKNMPNFKEGVDLVIKGYVIAKKYEENIYKLLISLWGFLLVIESKLKSILDLFDYMDEVYFKLEVLK
jgi:DNA-directed RNA polymerase subunit G